MTTIPRPNDKVGERYVIERELGRGGMATVFLARDLRHDTNVALKVLHPELAATLTGERFSREIRLTASLQHPNVVPVLDSGTTGGLPFYTMPFVEGETLAGRLQREAQLPLEEALSIAIDVADALIYAHERGVIHRDIKPQNILLSSGHAVLADFGIARAVRASASDPLTETGVAVGTAAYMSPEQAAGGTVDARSDLYSLGAVLYEMLAGAPVFTGPTPQSVMARHAVDAPPPITTVRPTVGPLLEEVLLRALAKVPADRFATARDLKTALAKAATEQLTVSRGEKRTSPRVAPRRRLIIALVTVVVAGVGLITGWDAMRPDPPELDENRVAVFPLTVRSGVGESPTLGEDLATTIGYALEETGGMQRVDGWRDAAELEGARRWNSHGERRRIAQSSGSAHVLVGDVLARGADSVEMLVRVLHTATDSLLTTVREVGRRGDESRLATRAVNRILPFLILGAFDRTLATSLVDRRPEVVTAFLRGEAALRRRRLVEARRRFREAVAGDSFFTLAAIRAAQAEVYHHEGAPDVRSLVALAERQPLPPYYRHFLRGLMAFVEGRADSAIRESRRAIALAPDMAWAWLLVGESYRHLLPVEGAPGWDDDSAFRTADRLEPSLPLAAGHLLESHLIAGRSSEAAMVMRRLAAIPLDSNSLAYFRLLEECTTKGPRAVEWMTWVTANPQRVLSAAKVFTRLGAQLPCSEAAYRAILAFETTERAAKDPNADARRWSALTGLPGVLIAQGRAREAEALIDSAIAREEGGQSIILASAAVVPYFRARGPVARQSYESQFGPLCQRCQDEHFFYYSMAAFAAATSDTVSLDNLGQALARRVKTAGGRLWRLSYVSGAASALARAVRAEDDAATALADMVAHPVEDKGALEWWLEGGRPHERLALSQVLLRRGEFFRAMQVASMFDSHVSVSHPTYLRASLALRAEAAESLSDASTRLAIRARLAKLALDSANAVAMSR